ncbi:MAG: hypothetical protein M0P73_09670 [Syntrophobacterales bacterium]|nr:hypothetical protein [Syntrophobacterales bacterium]
MAPGPCNLEITEVAEAALRWIKPELPPDRVHLGPFPRCIPAGRRFDLIYLSAVDYCLDTPDFIGLLSGVASCLTPGGKCLLLSASFDQPLPPWQRTVRAAKQVAAVLLGAVKLYDRGQFWGWLRTREDYRQAFSQAGYVGIKDGLTGGERGPETYWIEGRVARGGRA